MAHVFWRLYCLSNNGDGYTGVGDIEFHSVIGGPQRAVGGTAISSHTDVGYEPANAFDGSTSTRWQHGVNHDEWIGYQFASAEEIVEVAIRTSDFPRQTPLTWRLDYSDNGVSWTTKWVVTFGSDTYQKFEKRAFADPQKSIAWRLFSDVNNGDGYTGLEELIFRTVSGGPQAAVGGAPICSGYDSYPQMQAFDGVITGTNRWQAYGQTNKWIGYLLPYDAAIVEVAIVADDFPAQTPKSWGLEWSVSPFTSWTRALNVSAGSSGWAKYESRSFVNTGGGGSLSSPPAPATVTYVFPNAGQLLIAGLSALIQADVGATPGTGQLTITGHKPHAAPLWRAKPDLGQVTLYAFSPSLSWSGSASPGTGALTVRGLPPLVNVIVSSQLAVMALGGLDPLARSSAQATLAAVEIRTDPLVSALAILAAAEIVPPVALTQQAILILAVGEPCATLRCQLWRITRRDGEVLRYTSLDEDFVWGDETFRACSSLNPSASEAASTLGQVGNLELEGIVSDSAIREADLYGGLFDDCFVEVWHVTFDPDTGDTPRRLAAGWAGNLSHGEKGFKMEVLGPGARIDQQALVQTVAPSCRWVFGDELCTVDREALKLTGKVTAPRTRFQFTTDVTASGESAQWENGAVRWTSGENTGQLCEVKTLDFTTGEIVLWGMPAFQPAAGDSFDLFPGCDRLHETCKLIYRNLINFGGYPDVPGDDAIAEAPDAKV